MLIAAVIMLVDALTSGSLVSWVAFACMVVAGCFYVVVARGRLGMRPKGDVDEPEADRPHG